MESRYPITGIITALVSIGAVLLILSSLPVSNTIQGSTLITKYMLGNESSIDIEGVEFLPVPDDANGRMLRIGGTSLKGMRSGNFSSKASGTTYVFRTTGKGYRFFFQKDDRNYVVDLLSNNVR